MLKVIRFAAKKTIRFNQLILKSTNQGDYKKQGTLKKKIDDASDAVTQQSVSSGFTRTCVFTRHKTSAVSSCVATTMKPPERLPFSETIVKTVEKAACFYSMRASFLSPSLYEVQVAERNVHGAHQNRRNSFMQSQFYYQRISRAQVMLQCRFSLALP